MKQLLLLIFAVLLGNTLKSQVVFAAPGAEWRYVLRDGFGEYKSNITYTGDSVIGTETVKVLKYGSFYKIDNGGSNYTAIIRQSTDTLFIRNRNTVNTWQILYNFAATPGQHWLTTVKDSCFDCNHIAITHTVTVNSVSTVTINNMSLKKLLVTYCYNSASGQQCYTTDIIERIGCTTYLFNYFNLHAAPEYGIITDFLCYKDNAFGTKDYSTKGCDYAVGIRENTGSDLSVSVYPNPTNDKLHLEFSKTDPGNLKFSISNTLEQTVLNTSTHVINSKAELDLSSLPAGIYCLKIENETGYNVFKIVKE